MKNNFERYRGKRGSYCEQTTLVIYLVGRNADRVISKKLADIENIDVLELGCGSGKFTRLYYRQNRVTAIDINPQLFQPLPGVKVIKGNVADIKALLPSSARFDLVFSAWLTEYLCPADLRATLLGSREHLKKNGTIIFTFVSQDLLGGIYVAGARLKGIQKYNYSLATIKRIAAEAGLVVTGVNPLRRLGFGRLVTFKLRGK